jgi:hypothetical protein
MTRSISSCTTAINTVRPRAPIGKGNDVDGARDIGAEAHKTLLARAGGRTRKNTGESGMQIWCVLSREVACNAPGRRSARMADHSLVELVGERLHAGVAACDG